MRKPLYSERLTGLGVGQSSFPGVGSNGHTKDKGKGIADESLDLVNQMDASSQSDSISGEDMEDIRSEAQDGNGFQVVHCKRRRKRRGGNLMLPPTQTTPVDEPRRGLEPPLSQ